MNRFTTTVGSLFLAAALVAAPVAASAQGLGAHAGAHAHVKIDGNSIVHVIGAEVSSVSGAVINAVSTLGSTVINWVVQVSAATKISVSGSDATTTAAIKAGDKINFTGALTSLGSTTTVAATKVRDRTKVASSTEHEKGGDDHADRHGHETGNAVSVWAKTHGGLHLGVFDSDDNQ